MRLVTANIGRKQNVQQTRADFETIRRLKGIVGFQEIDEEPDPAPEHDFLRAVLGNGYSLKAMGTRVPIAVPKEYEVLYAKTVYGCDGVKKWSPPRFLTVVKVKKKETLVDKALRRTQKAFIVINVHYPAGGYHGDRPAAAKKELKNRWDELFVAHKHLIKTYVDKGYTVFWTGDVNRTDMPKVHPREVQVVTIGIDSVSYIEGDIAVKVKRRGHANLYSDHNAQYADFDLTVKK